MTDENPVAAEQAGRDIEEAPAGRKGRVCRSVGPGTSGTPRMYLGHTRCSVTFTMYVKTSDIGSPSGGPVLTSCEAETALSRGHWSPRRWHQGGLMLSMKAVRTMFRSTGTGRAAWICSYECTYRRSARNVWAPARTSAVSSSCGHAAPRVRPPSATRLPAGQERRLGEIWPLRTSGHVRRGVASMPAFIDGACGDGLPSRRRGWVEAGGRCERGCRA